MMFVVEKRLVNGELVRIGEAEGKGDEPILQVFEALEIGEHADYRVYPTEFKSDAVFYRLQLDGKLLELPHLGS
jgi:hypothetical protein